ncbi:hypothetical protein ACFL5T_00810 [Gemmatimonadota bacterium]
MKHSISAWRTAAKLGSLARASNLMQLLYRLTRRTGRGDYL